MRVTLYKNTSENNSVNKDITHVANYDCIVKLDGISLSNPVVVLNYTGQLATDVNYCYLEEYDRYYFIEEIIPSTGSRIILRLKCDLLYTFRNEILELNCIIDKQEKRSKSNMYLNDGSFVVQSNQNIEILPFSNGFNENGTYILICAGGNGNG